MGDMMYVLPICVIGILADIWFIRTEYAGEMLKATIRKGIASFFFVLLGIICYVNYHSNAGILILIGLILGMAGDIFLNMRNLYEGGKSNKIFAIGILAFLAGHFLYIAFLWRRAGEKLWLTFVLTAFFAACSIPPLMKQITAPSKGLKIFGYVYLIIVIMMFFSSVTLMVVQGIATLTVVFLIGALLFMVSDFIMIYYSFGKKVKPLRAINLLAYYAGQLMIACCIMYI